MRRAFILLLALGLCLSVTACGSTSNENSVIDTTALQESLGVEIVTESESTEKTKDEIIREASISFSVPDSPIPLLTGIQKDYMADDCLTGDSYSSGLENSRPEPFTVNWELKGAEELSPIRYEILLSLNEDMSNSVTYTTQTHKYDLSNLLAGISYYIKIGAIFENGTVESDTLSFETEAGYPRLLYVDGATNCRDIGGIPTSDGGSIPQGLFYRTGHLDRLTDNGKRTMAEVLKIKTEIDIRENEEQKSESMIGASVLYFGFPMGYKNGINAEVNFESIRNVFEVLANEENYPVALHCSIGTDRTGFICFLLESLLGAETEYIYRDYLFSNFGTIGGERDSSAINNYIKSISKMGKDSMSDNAYAYLNTVIGVPAENLDSIIEIFGIN